MLLQMSDLQNKTGTELAQAFASIPANVTSLDLSGNHLYNKTGAELALAFAAIPANVTSLDLSWNRLDNKTAAELALAFAAIPANVTSLDLSGNQLDYKTGAELALAFAAIPANVTSLNLSYNHFGDKTSAELAVAAIPVCVTSLDLSGNYLYNKTSAELALTFAAIPANVTSLNLSRNDLGNKTGAELALAFAAIPANVTSLDLSNNKLGYKSGAELALAFAAIPANVTSLNLRGNDFDNKTGAELAQIFAKISDNVKLIGLENQKENLLKHAENSLSNYKNSSDYTLPTYSKTKHEQTFAKLLLDIKLARAVIKNGDEIPDFLNMENLLQEEISNRLSGLTFEGEATHEELMDEFKKITHELVLPLKKSNKTMEMNILLSYIGTQANEIASSNISNENPIVDNDIAKLFSLDLACHAELMIIENKESSALFNAKFIRFCDYLETGKSTPATYEKIGENINQCTGRPSVSIPKYQEAWQYILKQKITLFNGGEDSFKQRKFILKGTRNWKVNDQIFRQPVQASTGYDDACLVGHEKKAARRRSFS